MGRLSASLLVLALGAAVALGLSACGGGDDADLLPGSTASEITSNLDRVEQLASEEECAGAAEAAASVSVQIEELDGVDAKLKQALREGATRLNEVVADCEEPIAEETPSIAPAEEPEEVEKPEKAEKPEKPEKAEKDAGEAEEETTPDLPPQAEGEAKGHEKQEEEESPVESEGGTPSGGVGPAEPAEGE
jgi:hypothetical protein